MKIKPCKWAKADHHRHRVKAHRKLSKKARLRRKFRQRLLFCPPPRRVYPGLIARELVSVEPMQHRVTDMIAA